MTRMKVVIFFDGANFFSGWADTTARRKLDFHKLADWLVSRVDGSRLWGAYYYTGVEASDDTLDPFLTHLESVPGYFVNRLPRKSRSRTCPACNADIHFTQEKEVDTSIVADMITLAPTYDICILVSGDADMCPAVNAVHRLGKQVHVATWSTQDLSSHLRRAAFDHIDLLDGLEAFALAPPPTPTPPTSDDFLTELIRAEAHFAGGYVGLSYFLTKWESPTLPRNDQQRRDALDRLIATDKVETYSAPDGTLAIRTRP
jgi:uncharacterized LabA/DUF88 family protein